MTARRILFLAFALAACTTEAGPVAPPPGGGTNQGGNSGNQGPTITTGSISGVVTDNTGAKVASAVVTLSGNAQPTRATTSAFTGAYLFTDVAPGSYTLTVAAPAGFTVGAASTTTVTVAVGVESATSVVLTRLTGDSLFVSLLRAQLDAAKASGQFWGTVLVERNGKTLFDGAYGFADRDLGINNTLLTKFRVGSMNKMLTAVAVLQLVQAGKLRLDVPLNTYLPDYPNASLASKVTLHHLLTHTGGTGDIFGSQFNANRLQLKNTDDYLQLYGTRGLLFEPGALWEYSNYGFMLLGAVIERVSNMSYDDYVATNILAPAGMTSTGALPEETPVPGRSVGYTVQGGALVSNASVLPYRGTPAGGWYSTVGDLARFAAAIRERRLLDATHTALLLDGKVVMGQSITKYAYGFIDRIQVGRRLVGHGGAYPGMSGELSFEPTSGYVVVVLSNLDPPASTMIEAFILSNLPN